MRERPIPLSALFVLTLAVLVAGGCAGGGGRPPAERTGTAEGIAHVSTATAAAAALPPVTQADIAGVIHDGFVGVQIPFTATTNSSFRKQDLLLSVLDDCAQQRGHGIGHGDEAYWPAVLGDCYTVGDATKWLFEYTNKRQFAYANQLTMRYMRQTLDQANANGAHLDDGYWRLVVDKIYTLTNPNTPIAATPLAESTVAR